MNNGIISQSLAPPALPYGLPIGTTMAPTPADLSRLNPRLIPNLALWLDSSDSATILTSVSPAEPAALGRTVRRWLDKSGNNRHGEQFIANQQPILTGDGIRFDGSNDRLQFYTAGLFIAANKPAICIFMCFRIRVPPISARQVTLHISTSANADFARAQLNLGVTSNKVTSGGRQSDGHTIRNATSTGNAPTKPFVYAGLFRYQSGVLQQRINQTLDGTNTFSASGNSSVNPSLHFSLGSQTDLQPQAASIDVRELLIFDTNMPDDTVVAIESYLASKWGVQL